jgi:hypothetical protein
MNSVCRGALKTVREADETRHARCFSAGYPIINKSRDRELGDKVSVGDFQSAVRSADLRSNHVLLPALKRSAMFAPSATADDGHFGFWNKAK